MVPRGRALGAVGGGARAPDRAPKGVERDRAGDHAVFVISAIGDLELQDLMARNTIVLMIRFSDVREISSIWSIQQEVHSAEARHRAADAFAGDLGGDQHSRDLDISLQVSSDRGLELPAQHVPIELEGGGDGADRGDHAPAAPGRVDQAALVEFVEPALVELAEQVSAFAARVVASSELADLLHFVGLDAMECSPAAVSYRAREGSHAHDGLCHLQCQFSSHRTTVTYN
jgi:hypothetical protein